MLYFTVDKGCKGKKKKYAMKKAFQGQRDLDVVTKANPYHDATGAFTSKDKAKAGGMHSGIGELNRKGKTVYYAHVRGVYREGPKEHLQTLLEEEDKEKASQPFVVPSPKNKLPKDVKPEQKKAMQDYMNGFHKSLKRENERAYAVDRSNQMINGEDRPSGMSAKYSMTKQRAVQYEALIYKIFLAGRSKIRV